MKTPSKVPVIETKSLKKYFKIDSKRWLHAVDDINLKIMQGETLGVVGESGCGKSTLGRVLLRLHEPTSGKLLFKGQDYTSVGSHDLREMRRNMQIIFQDPYSSINPRMTVADLIAENMVVNKMFRKSHEVYAEVGRLMDTVGLARRVGGSYPHELDGGRRQRIGVARALSLRPEFIVCDEPVSALDVSIQAQILNLLMDIQDEMQITYMFVTHDLSVVKHISDEIMVMYLGQCVEIGPADALFTNPEHPYTKALLDAIPEPDITMRHKELKVLEGEVSNPINPPLGCRFASRCGFCTDACLAADPPLVEHEDGHRVACVYANKVWEEAQNRAVAR